MLFDVNFLIIFTDRMNSLQHLLEITNSDLNRIMVSRKLSWILFQDLVLTALISEIMGVNDNFSIENLGDRGSNSIGSDASQSHVLVQGFDADSFGNFSKTDVTLGDFNEQQNSCELLDIQNQELCQESFFDSFEGLRNTSFNEISNDKWCLDFYH